MSIQILAHDAPFVTPSKDGTRDQHHAGSTSTPTYNARNGRHNTNGEASYGPILSVAEIAERLELKPQKSGGKIEYHGANPDGGATKDGFFIRENGTGYDRNGTFYSCKRVAELAKIAPDQYSPFLEWKERRGPMPSARPQTPSFARQTLKNGTQAKKPKAPFSWPRAQTFDYVDEAGELLFQVGRCEAPGCEKSIRQRQPDGCGGWRYSLEGARRVLWRLPDVLSAQIVFICEGEKAAGALNAALQHVGRFGECVATTSNGGTGIGWSDAFCESLEGTGVCVLPDFDEPGDTHGTAVCVSIHASGAAQWLCRVDLPGLPEKGDVCDWFHNGGDVAQLLELLERAPQWEPAREPEPEKAPSKLIRIGELRTRPAPKWLIQRFLVRNATSLFTADSGSYKSFIALHIAYCIAHGLPFFGRGVVESGPVVYVAGEGGDGLRARSMAWDKHHERDAPENLFVWESAVQLANAGEVAAFLAELEAAGVQPSLIVFDTLNRCAEGLDENSARDMGLFVAGLERIKRATGAHCCVVHHNNANGKSRGSTALPGAFDTRFNAEREGQTVILRCQKQKDGATEFEPFAVSAREVEIGEVDDFGDLITSLVLEPSDKTVSPERSKSGAKEQTGAAILAQLATLRANAMDGAKVSKKEWEEAVTKAGICARSWFYTHAKELEAAGRWFWLNGDCRLEETGENAEEAAPSPLSPPSPLLQKLDLVDLTGNREVQKSSPVHSPLGSGLTGLTGLDPASDANNSDKPKTRAPKKRAAATSEPYGVALTLSDGAMPNAEPIASEPALLGSDAR